MQRRDLLRSSKICKLSRRSHQLPEVGLGSAECPRAPCSCSDVLAPVLTARAMGSCLCQEAFTSRLPCIFSCLCGLTMIGLVFTASYIRFLQSQPAYNLVLGMIWGTFLSCMTASALFLARVPKFKPGREFVWASVDFEQLEKASPEFYVMRLEPGASKPCRERRLRSSEPKKWPQKTCLCCLEDFQPRDALALLQCGHAFHEVCMTKWLLISEKHGACPVCRHNVLV